MLFLSASLAIPAINTFAQTEEEPENYSPNRMLVVNELGQFVSFNVDHIADIRFVNIDTPPGCQMEFKEFSYERISLDIYPNEECTSYSFELLDAETAASLENDIDVIARLQSSPNAKFVEDGSELNDWKIAGEGTLTPGDEYEIIFAATDRYGTWDGVTRLRFEGPEAQIIGNPMVEVSYEYKRPDVIEVCMAPNDDTKEFYYLFGTEGRYTRHYDTWKDTLGFKSFEDMVVNIGTRSAVTVWQVWDALAPGTVYELITVAVDRRGNPVTAQFTTISGPKPSPQK